MPPSATVKGNTSSGVVEKLCQDPRVVTLPGWSWAQAFGRDIPSAKVIFYDAGHFARSKPTLRKFVLDGARTGRQVLTTDSGLQVVLQFVLD